MCESKRDRSTPAFDIPSECVEVLLDLSVLDVLFLDVVELTAETPCIVYLGQLVQTELL